MIKHYIKVRLSVAASNKQFVRHAVIKTAVQKDEEIHQYGKSWKEIPGPGSKSKISQILSFLPGGALHGYIGIQLSEALYKNYGPICKLDSILGSPTTIFLFDPECVSQVLRSEDKLPVRPGFESLEYYRKRHNKTYDPRRTTGLISDHGEIWKNFRSKVNAIMLKPKTVKLYNNVLEEVATDMIARLKTSRDKNNKIKNKFDTEMNLWALESIGVVALGTRLNCFDPHLPDDSIVMKLIQNVHNFFSITEKVDFRASPWRYISTPNFRKAMKIYEEQETLTKVFINKAIGNLNEKDKKSDDEKSILEKLLEIDINVAHIMASDMLMAGVDTTSNTVSATLYLLAINSEKQIKLREEILSKQSRHPYLRACIKESIRMLPVVNGNVRRSTKEYNILGYKIPKDMFLVFSHQYMSNMEEQFPRPKEYIPERWIVEKDDPLYYGNAHPLAYSPFGFGIRSCIGRRIAELEVEIFITKLIENFDIGWDGPPPKVTATALNYFTGPFHFTFKDLSPEQRSIVLNK